MPAGAVSTATSVETAGRPGAPASSACDETTAEKSCRAGDEYLHAGSVLAWRRETRDPR